MAQRDRTIRKPREHVEQLENDADAMMVGHHAGVVPRALDNRISEGRHRIHKMLTRPILMQQRPDERFPALRSEEGIGSVSRNRAYAYALAVSLPWCSATAGMTFCPSGEISCTLGMLKIRCSTPATNFALHPFSEVYSQGPT